MSLGSEAKIMNAKLPGNSTFGAKNEKVGDTFLKRIKDDNVFIINDIALSIPPTNIVISKEDVYWNWKTLRSKSSTKVPSGQGFCQVTVNIIFTPNLILHLHRLIVEIKHNPFVSVENRFLRDSLFPYTSFGNQEIIEQMAFAVSNFHVNEAPGLPGTMVVRMDMKYFNYKPYTPNYLYKKDYLTLPIRSLTNGSVQYVQQTIPVITGLNCTLNQVPIVIKDFEKDFEGFNYLQYSDFSSLLQASETNTGTGSLENTLNKFSGVLMDGMPLPSHIMPSTATTAYHSNIYKRYINQLQFESLYFNFNIDVYEMYHPSARADAEEKKATKANTEWLKFTTGLSQTSKGKLESSLQYREVQSFHLQDDSIVDSIIEKMHSHHSGFNFTFNEFISVDTPPFIERIKRKIMTAEFIDRINISGSENSFGFPNRVQMDTERFINTGKVNGSPTNTVINNNDTSKTIRMKDINGKDIDSSFTGHNSYLSNLKDYKKSSYNLHPPIGYIQEVNNDSNPYVNSGYGIRRSHPVTGKANIPHKGIDIKFEDNTRKGIDIGDLLKLVQNQKTNGICTSEMLAKVLKIKEDIKAMQQNSFDGKQNYVYGKLGLIPVFAIESGVIERIGNNGGFGNQIRIESTDTTGKSEVFRHSYSHLFNLLNKSFKVGDSVEKGDIIGFLGNSGAVTGPHVHLEVEVSSNGQWKNIPPYPLFNRTSVTKEEVEAPAKSSKKEEELKNYVEMKADYETLTDEENVLFNAYITRIGQLINGGYQPYTKGNSPGRVFFKNRGIPLNNLSALIDTMENDLNQTVDLTEFIALLQEDPTLANLETIEKRVRQRVGNIKVAQETFVTSCSGSFSNIIASIPIVGHEFPTTQHMGSMEPSYMFEIQSFDQNLPDNGLESISLPMKYLNAALNRLQEQGRRFREAPDSHAFCLDTFITRLLGSFRFNDIKVPIVSEGENLTLNADNAILTPRCISSKTQIMNVEGYPGRFLMNLEVSETNPFHVESIEVVKSRKETVDNGLEYWEILLKLDKVKSSLKNEDKIALLYSFISSFKGSFDWQTVRLKRFNPETNLLEDYSFSSNAINPITGANDIINEEGYFLLRSRDAQITSNLNDYVKSQYGIDPVLDLGIDFESVLMKEVPNTLVEQGSNTMAYFVSEEKVKEFYDENPWYKRERGLTGEDTIEELLYLVKMLKTIESKIRHTLVEEQVGGVTYGGKNSTSNYTVHEELWKADKWALRYGGNLNHAKPSFWKNYIYFVYYYLKEKVLGDKISDSLNAALGWSISDLNNYMDSIDFKYLYGEYDSENSQYKELSQKATEISKKLLWSQGKLGPFSSGTTPVSLFSEDEIGIFLGDNIEEGEIDQEKIADSILKVHFPNGTIDNDSTVKVLKIAGDLVFVHNKYVTYYEWKIGDDIYPILGNYLEWKANYILSDVKYDSNVYNIIDEFGLDVVDRIPTLALYPETLREVSLEEFFSSFIVSDLIDKIFDTAIPSLIPGSSLTQSGIIIINDVSGINMPKNASTLVYLFKNLFTESQKSGIVDFINNYYTNDTRFVDDLYAYMKSSLMNILPQKLDKITYETPGPSSNFMIHPRDKSDIEAFVNRQPPLGILDQNAGSFGAVTLIMADSLDWFFNPGGEDTELLNSLTGQTEAQLQIKAEAFIRARNTIWSRYVDYLNEKRIDNGFGANASDIIDNNFNIIKAYVNMRFSRDEIEKNNYTKEYRMFSSLQDYCSNFIEWFLEPRLINNIGLDAILQGASDYSAYYNKFFGGVFKTTGSQSIGSNPTSSGYIPASIADQGLLVMMGLATGAQGGATTYIAGSAAYNTTAGFFSKEGLKAAGSSLVGNFGGSGVSSLASWSGVGKTLVSGGKMAFSGAGLLLSLGLEGGIETGAYALSDISQSGDSSDTLPYTQDQFKFTIYEENALSKIRTTMNLINRYNSATSSYYENIGSKFDEGIIAKDLSNSTGARFENLDKNVDGSMFLWKDIRTDNSVLKEIDLSVYVNEQNEKAKVQAFRNELEALVKEILRNREVCRALDIPFFDSVHKYVMASEKYSGSSAYPDLDLPVHPFYNQDNFEVGPAFYMWDMYLDGGCGISKEYLDGIEANAKIYLEGAYSHIKNMEKGVISSVDFLTNTDQQNDAKDSNTLTMTNEATDQNKIPTGTKVIDGTEFITYQNIGEATSPFFTGQLKRSELTDEYKKELLEHLKATESESVTKYNFAFKNNNNTGSYIAETREQVVAQRLAIYSYLRFVEVDGNKTAKKGFLNKLEDGITAGGDVTADALITAGGYLLGADTSYFYDSTQGIASIGDAYSGFDAIPLHSLGVEKFKPVVKVNNYDTNLYYTAENQTLIKDYEKIQSEVSNIEKMFGNGAGYVGDLIQETTENSEEINKLLNDVKLRGLGSQVDYNQTFNLDGLNALAKASSARLFTEKKKVSQAFPTFKLFFIEEDEFESRFINMDDFYSFNGVRSFTVNRSRENAADTAIISLQNVAGTLDGTRRGTTVDVDYFNKKKVERLKRENKNRPGYVSTEADNFNLDSETDQPFSAVVMRPGMNVQLRAGYSNNPDNLEVLISGRVTDISWGGAGDICEIVVQSFGTELIQQIKGIEENNDKRIYYATHQILGDLMLSPELKHFGRWETGKIFQYGEAQDARLDFFKYKANGTTAWYQSIFDWQNFLGDYYIPLGISTAVIAIGGLTLRRFGLSGSYIALSKAAQKSAEVLNKTGSFPGKSAFARFTEFTYDAIIPFLTKGFRSIFNTTFAGPLEYLGRFRSMRLLGQGRFNSLFGPDALRNALLLADDAHHLLVGVADDLIKFSRSLVKELEAIGKSLKEFARYGGQGLTNQVRLTNANVIESLKTLRATLAAAPNAALVKMHKEILTKLDDLIKILGEADGVAVISTENAAALGRILNMTDELALALVSPNYPTRAIFLQGFKQAGAYNLLAGSIAYASDFGFAYIPIFLKTAIIYTMADNFIMGGMVSTYKEYREAYKNWFTKELVYFKLNPADDNLYPPSPVYYMHNVNAAKDTWTRQLGAITTYAFSEFSGASGKSTYEFLKQWKESNPIIYLKRVLPITCQYNLEKVTIWDVFHEMSLRHPGWIYSAVPYGKEFRYTMFFGIPSQRYWSKPASPAFIKRMNTVREVLTSDSTDIDSLEIQAYGKATNQQDVEAAYEEYETNVPILLEQQFYATYDQLTGNLDKKREKQRSINTGFWMNWQKNELGDPFGRGELFNISGTTVLDTDINWSDYDNKVNYFQQSSDTEYDKVYEGIRIYIDSYKDSFKTYKDIEKSLERELAQYENAQKEISAFVSSEDLFTNVDKDNLKRQYSRYYNGWISGDQLKTELATIWSSRNGSSTRIMNKDEYVTQVRTLSFRSRLMKEYLTGLQNRFVPFRNYHLIRSKENLVRNNFTLSLKNAVNSVNVYYSEVDDNNSVVATKSIFLKASSNIPDENLQTQNVDSYEGNIRSRPMATRYGISSLIYGMKEMYGGELTILGDPTMKPWDVCFLFDDQNKMSGPFEIKAITHIFSFETGFLTEIVPNAVVVGNETSSWPIIEALKVYVAGALSRENLGTNSGEGYQGVEGSVLIPAENGEFSEENLLKALSQNAKNVSKELEEEQYGTFTQKFFNYREPGASASFNGYNLSFETSESMITRYSDLVQDGIIKYKAMYNNPNDKGEVTGYQASVDTSAIFNQLNSASNEFYGDYYDFSKLAQGYAEDLYELGVSGIVLGNALRPLSGTTREAAIKVGTVGTTLLLGSLAQGLKGKVIAGSFGLLTYGISVGNQYFDNRDKILDRFTSSYLIAAPIIFSKLMENEAVTIVPVVKEGKPLLAGVSTRSPTSVWKNILGDILSSVDDSFKGMFDTINENEAMGSEFYRYLVTRNKERRNDPGLRYLKESGQLINLIKGN